MSMNGRCLLLPHTEGNICHGAAQTPYGSCIRSNSNVFWNLYVREYVAASIDLLHHVECFAEVKKYMHSDADLHHPHNN